MKRFLPLMSFFVIFALGVPALLAKAPPQPPAGTIELNWTKRPVQFSHEGHLKALGGTSCSSCHHPVGGKTVYQSCAAKGCHDNLNSKDTSPQSYYQAIHKAEGTQHNSCVSCHTKKAGQDPAAIKRLAGCRGSGCHP